MNLMKKILYAVGVVALACTAAFGDVAINSTNFPDAAFRNYVSVFDKDGNGTLSNQEISKVNLIFLFRVDLTDLVNNPSGLISLGVMNLKGIEHFTALRWLFCSFTYDEVNNLFNYTDFKIAYGLECDIDDSWPLDMAITMGDRTGLMSNLTGDIVETSNGDCILKFPMYTGQSLEHIDFFTKGTPAIHVYVLFSTSTSLP